MARWLVCLLSAALAASAVYAEDGAIAAKDERDGEPGGVIVVRVFQPHAFGGVMIRGRCGTAFVARDIPIFARVLVREIPVNRDLGSVSSEPNVPWAHGEAEAVVRSMENLFALSHPLSVFREDLGELDQWQHARLRALEEIRDGMMQSEDRKAATGSDFTGGDGLVASSTLADDASKAEEVEGQLRKGFEWTPVNIMGMVLLAISFALLVGMLLLSLSTIIYGCSEQEPEPSLLTETTVETPLLDGPKAAAEAGSPNSVGEDGSPVVNPLCKYMPPGAKA